MFTPVSLYQLERQNANNFITQTLKSFDWFIFLFYGEFLEKSPISIENVPFLAELAARKILIIDFLPTSDHTRNYLYGSWRQHCPPEIDGNLVNLLQHSYELGITDQEREALERLFYTNLFCGDFFQPSLAIVNMSCNYIIRRKFTYQQHDKDLQSSLINFIEMVEDNESLLKNYDSHKLGKLFNPRKNPFYKPRVASQQSLEDAFANFLDSAEDALSALNPESNTIELESLKINTTEKFIKSFKELNKTVQDQSIMAIKRLISQHTIGLGLKKINLSNQMSIYRMRITRKHRIHFQGTPDNPIFINIGAHRLSDHGYTVD